MSGFLVKATSCLVIFSKNPHTRTVWTGSLLFAPYLGFSGEFPESVSDSAMTWRQSAGCSQGTSRLTQNAMCLFGSGIYWLSLEMRHFQFEWDEFTHGWVVVVMAEVVPMIFMLILLPLKLPFMVWRLYTRHFIKHLSYIISFHSPNH